MAGRPWGAGRRREKHEDRWGARVGLLGAREHRCLRDAGARVRRDHQPRRPLRPDATVARRCRCVVGAHGHGSLVVYVATRRIAHRALPLAALLRMTLVFPDKAPSRLAVARRAGSTKTLERQLVENRARGADLDEPTVAAEHILALAASMNRHDRLTRGHSERVRAFTDLIADELEACRARQESLALVGSLARHRQSHGARFDPQQAWKARRRGVGAPTESSSQGARLTASLTTWLGPWADAISQHHERYDGKGYPYGLAGNNISVGGRIVAVADSYETMTAVRSYKSAMTPVAARKQLVANAGSQFDPAIVRAFLDVSVGSNRLLGGVLASLSETPLLTGLSRIDQLARTAGLALLATVAVSGVVAGATAHHIPAHHPAVASTGHQHGRTPPVRTLDTLASLAPQSQAWGFPGSSGNGEHCRRARRPHGGQRRRC